MSYKTEVKVDGSWSTNSCRFATEDEATRAGHELLSRWWVPTDSRAAESSDPVNYEFPADIGRPRPLTKQPAI